MNSTGKSNKYTNTKLTRKNAIRVRGKKIDNRHNCQNIIQTGNAFLYFKYNTYIHAPNIPNTLQETNNLLYYHLKKKSERNEMGSALTKLVFRPPNPTPIKQDKFFYIQIPQTDEELMFSSSCAPNVGCSIMPHNLETEISEHLICEGPHLIPAFFLLRKNAKYTILYSHGNAEDLGMMYKRMRHMAQVLCVNVLAYDYSGYGLSRPQCKPSEKMCYRNIDAVYSYLVNVMKIPSSRIVLYGRSLGSGPTCYLAKKTADEGKPVGGVILHSPFLSIYRIVLDLKSGFVGDIFQNYKRASFIQCPVLIIHGEADKVVPFWHAEELLTLVPPEYRAKPYFVKGAGHNGIEVRKKEEYVHRVSNFIEKCVQKGIVPEEERCPCLVHQSNAASTSTAATSHRSTINETWVKYGKEIIRHVLKSPSSQPTSNHPSLCFRTKANSELYTTFDLKNRNASNESSCPMSDHVETSIEIIDSSTREKLMKLIQDDEYSCDADGNDQESALEIFATIESWETDGTNVKDWSFDSMLAMNLAESAMMTSSSNLPL